MSDPDNVPSIKNDASNQGAQGIFNGPVFFQMEEKPESPRIDSKSEITLITGHIPHKNQFFIGRNEELEELQNALLQEKIAVVVGMPGIGKTQIAAQYVYQHQYQYQYIIWANASSFETLITDYDEFAKSVKLPPTNNQAELLQEVKIWLQQHENYLLVLDNVENLLMAKNNFILTSGRGHIILTTQLGDIGNISSKLIEVKPVRKELGALFLLRRAGKISLNRELRHATDNDREAALEISRLVEGYLLLLDIAGATIRQSKCNVSDYLDEYNRQPIPHLSTHSNDYPDSVMRVFSLTSKKIEAISPDASKIIDLCSFFFHGVIPAQLVKKCLIKQRLVSKNFNFNDAIAALNTFSLVERDTQTDTISFHRLTQETRRYTMNHLTEKRWEKQTIQAMGKAFPNVEPEVWNYCQLCLPHAQACIRHFEQRNTTSNTSLLSIINWLLKPIHNFTNKTFVKDVSRLHYQVAHYLQERNSYSKAELLMQKSLKMRKKAFGLKHIYTAKAMHRLATIYYGRRKIEQAEELFQQALVIFEYVSDRGVAETLNNLASIYRYQGRYKEAEVLYQRALQIRQAEFGLESNQTAKVLNGLAELYRVQGNHKQSESFALQALEICKQKRNISRDTAQMLKSLSELYRNQGRYEEAEVLCKESFKHYKQVVGFNHPEVANCLNRLARFYWHRNQYKVAECLCQKALEIDENVLGPEHPALIYDLNSLARTYREQKVYPEKTGFMLRRALQIAEKTLQDHPQTAECLINLAAFYSEGGNYQEAEKLYLQAIHMNEQLVGPKHLQTAFAFNSLARHYRHRKDYLKAEPFFQQALEIHKQVLGENNINTAHCYFDLAWNYDAQRLHEQAQTYYEYALRTYIQVLGPVNADTLKVVKALSMNYRAQHKYPEVNSLNQHIIDLLEHDTEQKTQSRDIQVAHIYFQRAKGYSISKQHKEATRHYKQALMIYVRAFGSEYPYTIEALHLLEKFDKTEISNQKALEEYLQELGSKHIQLIQVFFNLARSYSSNHENEMAVWFYFRTAFILEYKLPHLHRTQKEFWMLKSIFKSLGYHYSKMGNKEDAKYFFDRANNMGKT